MNDLKSSNAFNGNKVIQNLTGAAGTYGITLSELKQWGSKIREDFIQRNDAHLAVVGAGNDHLAERVSSLALGTLHLRL
jgi:hypothetical protein